MRVLAAFLRWCARWLEGGAEKAVGRWHYSPPPEEVLKHLNSPAMKWQAVDSAGNVIPPSVEQRGHDADV